MKKYVIVALILAFAFSGCENKTENNGETAENQAEEQADGQTDENEAAAGAERDDGEITSEKDGAGEAFDRFFDCYSKTEKADSVTKDKQVEIVMFEESDTPYSINSKTHYEKVKKGEEYSAYFELDDEVADNSNKTDATYDEGFLYYEIDGKKYKQPFTWDDVKYMIDGYNFKLYEYTVSNIHSTTYQDGYEKLEFQFNLQNLAEAPDEEIFEILSATASSYKNLSFNDASFEAYISPEGYVESYTMYYDGQVAAADDLYTFKYRTMVSYSDIDATEISYPKNTDEYEYVEAPTEAETQ